MTKKTTRTTTRKHWTTFVMFPMDWAVDPPPRCALQVWAVLWDHRGRDGSCWPSQERIIACTQSKPGDKASGLNVRSVRRGLRWLEGKRAKGRGPKLIESIPGRAGRSSTYSILWTTSTPPERYAEAYSAINADSFDRVTGDKSPTGPDKTVRQTKNKRNNNFYTKGASAPVDGGEDLAEVGLFQEVVSAWMESGCDKDRTRLGPIAITKGIEILRDAGINIPKTSTVGAVVRTWVNSIGDVYDGQFVEGVRVYVANVRDKWFPMPADLAAFIGPDRGSH